MVCGYFRKYIPIEILVICTFFHANHNFSDEGSLYSVNQARYVTSIVAKYLDTATVKKSTKFYNTTLPSDIIFTKADTFNRNKKFDTYNRESTLTT